MKKFTLLATVVVVLAACMSACSSTKTLAGDNFQFSVPHNWKVHYNAATDGGEAAYDYLTGALLLVEVNDSKFHKRVYVQMKPIPAGGNLEQVVNETYTPELMQFMRETSTTTGELDGKPTIVMNYQMPEGEPWYWIKDVWLEHAGQAYLISLWSIYTAGVEGDSTFDEILASFSFD